MGNSFRVFVLAQVAVAVIIAGVVLFGDHTRINGSLASNTVAVNQPIILNLNVPLKQSSVVLTLQQDGTKVPGSLTWSSSAVAFYPTHPLTYASTYQLEMSKAEDIEGHVLRSPLTFSVHTDSERFLYITSSGLLDQYTVSTHQSQQITPSDQTVTEYAISDDGTQLLVSYHLTSDPMVRGLELGTLANGSAAFTTLDQGSSVNYLHPAICENGQYGLLFENTLNEVGTGPQLVSFLLSPSGFAARKTIGSGTLWAGVNSLACQATGNQIAYQDPPGNTYVSDIQGQNTAIIGTYQAIYGFSPQDDQLLVGSVQQTSTGSYWSVISVAGSKGKRTVGDATSDSRQPNYDALEGILAASVNQNWQTTQSTSDISLYQTVGRYLGVYAIPSTAGFSDEYPVWASSGETLTFERVPQATTSTAQNQPEESVDGEIWLSTITGASDILTAQVSATDLHISGSSVTWLP